MPEALTGTCACGTVTATFSAEPVRTRLCWCRQCQKIAEGGPTHGAVFHEASVSLTGDTMAWSHVAPDGHTVLHTFCSICGTRACSRSSAEPEFVTFCLAFLDKPHGLAPQIAIWTAERPPHAPVDPALPEYPQRAPALSAP